MSPISVGKLSMVQEPDDDLSPLDQEVAQELGPVIFRARRRSQKDVQAGLSGDSSGAYVLPFFAGLIGMLVLAGLVMCLKSDPESLQAPRDPVGPDPPAG